MTSIPAAPAAIHLKPTVTPVSYDHPDARRLTQALRAEQLGLYGFADDPDTTPDTDFDAPQGGLFLVARLDEKAVGCAGVRLLDEDTAEIKRMYVSAEARGLGLGRFLLDQLERHVASRGAARIMLETGRLNTSALALYDHNGYRPCPSYVPGRDQTVNRAMTKRLGTPDGSVISPAGA